MRLILKNPLLLVNVNVLTKYLPTLVSTKSILSSLSLVTRLPIKNGYYPYHATHKTTTGLSPIVINQLSFATVKPKTFLKKVCCQCLPIAAVAMGASSLAKADSILGIEVSPAVCKLNPAFTNMRQCVEGHPLTVNFFRVTNQNCTNQPYSVTPLQETLVSKVIPEPLVRHQLWQNYGRCSGMNASSYFRKITGLASDLKLPKELSSGKSYRVNSSAFVRQIGGLNAGMQSRSVNLFCQKNRNNQLILTHINVCYNNQGRFGQCAVMSASCGSQFYIDGNY